MSKIFVGDVGTLIRLDAGIDVSAASAVSIAYTKPDGTQGTWTGSANGQYVEYTIQANDLDQAGEWCLQNKVDGLGGWTGYGEQVVMVVYALCL